MQNKHRNSVLFFMIEEVSIFSIWWSLDFPLLFIFFTIPLYKSRMKKFLQEGIWDWEKYFVGACLRENVSQKLKILKRFPTAIYETTISKHKLSTTLTKVNRTALRRYYRVKMVINVQVTLKIDVNSICEEFSCMKCREFLLLRLNGCNRLNKDKDYLEKEVNVYNLLG